MSESVNIENKYRTFLRSSIVRLVVSRLFSIAYIVAIARIMPKGTQDLLVVLAYGQTMIVQLALFGIGVSAVQIGISTKMNNKDFFESMRASFLMSVPLVVIGYFIFINLFDIGGTYVLVLFTITMSLQLLMEYILIIKDYQVETDKKLMVRTLYSVFNSIIVPLMFWLMDDIESVLYAWILATLISMIPVWRDVRGFVGIFGNMKQAKHIIRVGMPVYIGQWFNIFAQRMDAFLLFKYFGEGDTAQYYWMLKLSAIVQEVFMIMINGLLPLLAVYYRDRTRVQYESLVHSLIRIGYFVGGSMYALGMVYGRIGVRVLLTDSFIGGVIVLKILLVGRVINIFSIVLYVSASAQGKMKRLMWQNILSDSLWIISILAFIQFGGVGMAFALVVNRIAQSVYMFIVHKDMFDSSALKRYFRPFLFSIAIIGIGWFEMIFLYPVLYVMCVIIIKPLHVSDWEYIVRIIKIKNNNIKRLLVHG